MNQSNPKLHGIILCATLLFLAGADAGYAQSSDTALPAAAEGAAIPADAETVEMEDISITAEPEQAQAPTVESSSSAKIDDMPTGGDPFDVVRYVDAVVEETLIADSNYTITDTVLGFTRGSRAFSVYGGDSDFNSYYFDFMRIPMNKHAESNAPIVSVWAIDRIDTWKGITPLERGPCIGGTFVAVPDEYMEKDRQFILSPDTSLVNLTWKQKLPGGSGLVISASKSLTELFVPLIFKGYQILYDAIGMPIFDDVLLIPSFGDICARLFLKGNADRLDLDLLGFYDCSITKLDMPGRYDASGTALPYFVSGGGKWTHSPSGSSANSLYAYASWQDRNSAMTADLDIESYLRESLLRSGESLGVSEADIEKTVAEQLAYVSGSVQLEAKPRIRVFAVDAGDTFSWYLSERIAFQAGASARFASVDGQYEGFTHANLSMLGFTMKEDYTVPLVTMADKVLRAHAFAKASFSEDSFASSLGAAYTWFPLHGTFVPSLEADGSWDVSERFCLAGRAGWSAAYYDEFAFAERRLNEDILGIEGKSSYASLPRSLSCTFDAAVKLGKGKFSLEPYFAFYYNLSGLALYASWIDPYKGDSGGDLFKQTSSVDPDIGRSLGTSLSWESDISDSWSSRLSWTPASTQYRNRADASWFRSNNDVSHTLKYAIMYQRPTGIEFTGTLNAYAGKPFTPELVVAPGILQKQGFNTAADWIPRVSLGLNIKWSDKFLKKLEGRYEFNCANVLALFSPTLKGMKAESLQTVGASTTSFEHRDYGWLKTDLFALAYAMGLKLGGTYFF